MHLRLTDNLNVDVSGTLSITAPAGDNSPSIRELESCLDMRIRRRVDAGRVYYSVGRSGLSASDFQDLKRCLINAEWVGAEFRRIDRFFSVEYQLSLRLFEVPHSPGRGEAERQRYLPKMLNVVMPGDDISIRDVSQPAFANMAIDKISPTQANITLSMPEAVVQRAAAELSGLCPGGSGNCPARRRADDLGQWPVIIPVTLEITSTSYKYGVNEFLAVLALLFGSGLVFGVGKWFISRRTPSS